MNFTSIKKMVSQGLKYLWKTILRFSPRWALGSKPTKIVVQPQVDQITTTPKANESKDAYKSMLVIADDNNHNLRLYYDINDYSDDACLGFVNMVMSLTDGRFTNELVLMLKKVQQEGHDTEKTFVSKVLMLLNRNQKDEDDPYIRPLGRHSKE